MFYQNRFTERAAAALQKAQETAGELGHSYVGSEHLLTGLLKEGGGVAYQLLNQNGLTADKVIE